MKNLHLIRIDDEKALALAHWYNRHNLSGNNQTPTKLVNGIAYYYDGWGREWINLRHWTEKDWAIVMREWERKKLDNARQKI